MSLPTESNPQIGGGQGSNLQRRVASALVLAPIALAAIWFGGALFGLFVGLAAMIVLFEWLRMALSGLGLLELAGFLGQFVVVILALFAGNGAAEIALAVLIAAAALAALLGAASWWLVGGLAYSGLPLVSLLALREDQDWGFAAVILVAVVVWATDIAAYFCGRAIGGPKLWPAVSPKKTWAGAIGGALAAVASAMVVASVLGFPNIAAIAAIAAALSIGAQGGDLLESSIKRHFGAKDSGDIIPGHGGIMDRVDGLIAASVLAALIGFAHMPAARIAAGLVVW